MGETAHSRTARKGLGYEDYRPVLERLLALLAEWMGPRLLAVALFGSAARGQARPDSDLDLLIVHEGEREEAFQSFLGALRELRRTPEQAELRSRGVLADPYPLLLSRQRLAETPWILLDILDHGIILFDREGALQSKLASLRRRLDELGSRKVVLPDGTWYWDLKPDWVPGEVIRL